MYKMFIGVKKLWLTKIKIKYLLDYYVPETNNTMFIFTEIWKHLKLTTLDNVNMHYEMYSS